MIKATISSPDGCIIPKLPPPPRQQPALTVQSTILDGDTPKQIESKITTQESFFQNPFSQRLATLEQELRNILASKMSIEQKVILYKSTLNEIFATDKSRYIPHKKRNIGLNLGQMRAAAGHAAPPAAGRPRGRPRSRRRRPRARSLSPSRSPSPHPTAGVQRLPRSRSRSRDLSPPPHPTAGVQRLPGIPRSRSRSRGRERDRERRRERSLITPQSAGNIGTYPTAGAVARRLFDTPPALAENEILPEAEDSDDDDDTPLPSSRKRKKNTPNIPGYPPMEPTRASARIQAKRQKK